MPKVIKPNQIGEVLAEHFKGKKYITCYVSSNAVTPTASMEALTESIKTGTKLPFMRMVSLLLLGPVPYVEPGLQDRIMAYSIFSGPVVRKAVNEGRAYYLPCTLANMESMIGRDREYQPDVVFMKVCQNPVTGEYNLGPSLEAIHIAIDQAKIIIAELDNNMPFVCGGNIDISSIDYLIVEGVKPIHVYANSEVLPLWAQRGISRVGELIVKNYIKDGATLQIGIGEITDAIAASILNAGCKDLGCQTELYGDGLALLQRAGIITNRHKKVNPWYSTTSLIMGSRELYDFVDKRLDIQLRSCIYTNAMSVIRANGSKQFPFVSINTAVGIDLGGNIWADYINASRHYGGVGGQPDFIRALNDPQYGVAIIAMLSTTTGGMSKIVKTHPAGVTLTACSYDNVIVVTEYGIANLKGLTTGCKALALASIAHPSVREELLQHIHNNPLMFVKSRHADYKTPSGVILYDGPVNLPEK